MKKVCHMTSAHSSDDVRIFYKECTSLANAGYDVYLVAKGESREENGVRVVGVGHPPKGRLARMTVFSMKVYKTALSLNADIYHIHDPELLPYGLKLKRHGKKVIFDSHENYPMQITSKGYLPKAVRKLVAGVYKRYETRVVKRLDAVITVCLFNGKNIFDKRARRVVVIDNYPLLTEFYQKFTPSEKKRNYVCCCGGLTKGRGITALVQAAAMAGKQAVLAGRFTPPAYEQELATLPEYRYVDYRGFVGRDEVANIYAHALAGAQLLQMTGQYSASWSLGVKSYEYMSMGIPLIISRFHYAEKIVAEYDIGICIDPHDIEDVAKAIKYLADNPQEAKRMGANGRKAILEHFNWENEGSKMLELYVALSNEAIIGG